MTEIHARLQVLGRVQGVGFRWYTQRQANKYGVKGWVRNKRDGSVELEAWADRASFAGFLAAVRTGPAIASVTGVEVSPVTDGAARERPVTFEILPTA